jgi:hypothetical protein
MFKDYFASGVPADLVKVLEATAFEKTDYSKIFDGNI